MSEDKDFELPPTGEALREARAGGLELLERDADVGELQQAALHLDD